MMKKVLLAALLRHTPPPAPPAAPPPRVFVVAGSYEQFCSWIRNQGLTEGRLAGQACYVCDPHWLRGLRGQCMEQFHFVGSWHLRADAEMLRRVVEDACRP